jgi:hypothetical protein
MSRYIDADMLEERRMTEIKLTKRYPNSREEDITDAFMRGYEIGKEQEHRWWSTFCANCKDEPNSSEKPNNCEDLQDWKDRMWAEAIVTEPTISKMEQVDKDTNVRSKTEPLTCSFSDCDNFKNPDYARCIECKRKQIEPKTEPQAIKAFQDFYGIKAEPTLKEMVEPQTERWSEEEHKAFYTFLWNTINPNEMQDYIEMFETKDEPQTERSE